MTTGTVGVLDTNTLILIERLRVEDLPAEPLITAITLAELSVGPLLADDETERAARQARLQEAEAVFEPLPFDASAARAYGRVATSLRRAGRKPSARAFDALIAATAIANDLLLYTCNPRDFDGIDDVTVVPVPHPRTGA
ncbi:MAG TPA: type II toxin-antitoxin system VapC family toxin [Acidimicrobiales bacterium]|nr:type II toxin-antitoxin system VapC family toxin [Acidimicrobiales bacterium]